jgi:hypothetical protein
MDTLVDFIELQGVHSGENLSKAFVACCKEFNILTKVCLHFFCQTSIIKLSFFLDSRMYH